MKNFVSLFKSASLAVALAAVMHATAWAEPLCNPDTVADSYWERIQELESKENGWLWTYTAGVDQKDRAAIAAERQKPRQKLYRKMVQLDKAARRAGRRGDYAGKCAKTEQLNDVLNELVNLMELQLLPPEDGY